MAKISRHKNSMKNKTILITGASSGIGAACAERFAQEGANLILVARREERLNVLAAKLEREFAINCLSVPCDISTRETVEACFHGFSQELAQVDVLINNAGLALSLDKLQDANPAHWSQMIDVNIKGLLYTTHLVLSHMVVKDNGHIVNIASTSSHNVYAGGSVYCATKHAVDALSRGLRLDLAGKHIRVSQVSPGLVETEFSQTRFAGDKEQSEAVYHGFEALTGNDIADSVAYCVNAPANVNVSEIIVMPVMQHGYSAVYRED